MSKSQAEHLLGTDGLWHLKSLLVAKTFRLDPSTLTRNDAFELYMSLVKTQTTAQLERDLAQLVVVQNKSKHQGTARNAVIAELRWRMTEAKRDGRTDP